MIGFGRRARIDGRVAALPATAFVALALTLAGIAEAGAGRTRPGGRSSGGSVSAGVRVSGGSSATRASGHATYGYGHRGGGYGHGWHGNYYWGWGLGWGWGYPYWGYPYRGWPSYYGPSYLVLAGGPNNRAPGAVETDVKPGKAAIHVDGVYVGQARDYNGKWDRLWVQPGSREIEFSKEGYQTLRLHVDVRGGGYAYVSERMIKGEGLDPRSTEPPPPKPKARATAPSPVSAAQPPRRPSGGALRRGLLRLEIQPADAAVYLDGEFFASGEEINRLHGAIPLAVGPHAIDVVRPGYASRSLEVEVDDGDPVRLRVDLEPGGND